MKVLVLLLVLLPALVSTYTVVRKDGRPFSGDLVSETSEHIILEDKIGITVKFRKDQLDLEKTKKANEESKKDKKGSEPVTPKKEMALQTKKLELSEDSRWTGERISIDFKDVDIRDFFLFIAEISGMNMILDPAVKGTLTIKLTDVPWDQALDLVCRQHGLGYQIDGNVYSVK
ncbi:secretin and TonB N-terminal domain-containing protein [bacterium]|nr:secretin and TonB N-terminal domain-containing protein [bacterium]